jgi:hypothetical protein
MSKLKILFFDLESSPLTAHVWGLWQQNVSLNQIIDTSSVLCYSAKWLGDKKVVYDGVNKYKGKDARKKMLLSVHKLLDEADVVVTWNGKSFDIPTMNKEFILHGMAPPSPYKQLDLLQVARKQFRFASNKLDFVSKALDLGSKRDHEGFMLWVKCMKGDKKAWATMEAYNKQDVVLLEKVYYKLLPWIPQHPTVSTKEESCPVCGSHHLQSRGTATNKTGTYRRFQCQDCGSWSSGEVITKHKKKYKQL